MSCPSNEPSGERTSHDVLPDRSKLVAKQLLDNALIGSRLLDDATSMVARLNKLLESV